MKKILTFILSIVMITSIFSYHALADYTDSDMANTPCVYGVETWKLNFDASAIDKTAKSAEKITDKGNFAASKTTAALYKMKMPEIPAGKILGSAQFRVTSYYSSARPIYYAYKFPESDYDMESFTIGDAQKYINSSSLGTGEYYLTKCIEDSAFSAPKNYRSRYDVTDYIKECINDGQEYFWIAVTHSSANTAYPHDSSTDYWRPKLFYTVEDAPQLEVLEISPEDGAESVMPEGDVELSFSNTITSAKAFVNGEEASVVDIYSDSVVIGYSAEENSPLKIEVEVTDEYNQTLNIVLNYKIARNITIFKSDAVNSSYCIGKGLVDDSSDYKNESHVFSGFTPSLKNSDGGAVFYEIPLPESETGKYFSSYLLNVYTQGAADDIKAYALPADCSMENGLYIIKEDNMSLNDEKTLNNVADIIYDYETNKAGDTVCASDEDGEDLLNVELTALARERAENGETGMIIALTSESGAEFSSHISDNDINAFVTAEIENNPKIKTYGDKLSLWGNELLAAAFGVYTDAESLCDSVCVLSEDGDEVSDAKFEYNRYSNRIELSEKITLEENVKYTIIIKSGASDKFGNTLSEDLTVMVFETKNNIPVTPDEREALWKILVSSDDAGLIGEKWSLISAVFDFDAKLFEDFTDAGIFYERLASDAERKTFSQYSEANTDKVKSIVLDIAGEVAAEQKLLKSIWNASHISAVSKIITDTENAKLLGIEEYVGKYKTLYSTDYVDTQLTKEKYHNTKDFRDIFIPALTYALSNNSKPSGGGGSVGGGASRPSLSGGATVGSFVPSIPNQSQTQDSVSANTQSGVFFDDTTEFSWANEAINSLASKKLINGKANRKFAPSDNVTRAEFTAMIVRAANLESVGSDCDFADVSDSDWYYTSVASAVSTGIINGTGSGFMPNQSITRQDMAVIIHRVITKFNSSLSERTDFADSDLVSDYAKEAVCVLGGAGIVSGLPGGNFEPRRNLTRAEAAVVIYNVFTNFIEEGEAK